MFTTKYMKNQPKAAKRSAKKVQKFSKGGQVRAQFQDAKEVAMGRSRTPAYRSDEVGRTDPNPATDSNLSYANPEGED